MDIVLTMPMHLIVQTQSIISPQNQDRLRLSQHWWWKFQMLICNPYNYIELYIWCTVVM